MLCKLEFIASRLPVTLSTHDEAPSVVLPWSIETAACVLKNKVLPLPPVV
jgi:hypothetical protein